jgi:tRNA(fMet)-specific endonuclease VapC
MPYLPDSNVFIRIISGNDRALAGRLQIHRGESVLSSIVLHELMLGAYGSNLPERSLAVVADIRLPLIEFDRDDARVAAEVRADLKRKGTPIGRYDVLIAGQALARGLTLVTSNVREFARVEGLAVEDWR